MNRSALNSTILGSGGTLRLSFVAASQALYLIAVMTATVIRRGIVHQNLSLSSINNARITRFFKAVEAMSLQYSADCHAWVLVYAKAVQNFVLGYQSVSRRTAGMKAAVSMALTSTIRSYLITRGKAVQAAALSGAVRLRTAVRIRFSQALSLFGNLTAFDVTTTPANSERTAVVENASRVVVVPGESYDAGV